MGRGTASHLRRNQPEKTALTSSRWCALAFSRCVVPCAPSHFGNLRRAPSNESEIVQRIENHLLKIELTASKSTDAVIPKKSIRDAIDEFHYAMAADAS